MTFEQAQTQTAPVRINQDLRPLHSMQGRTKSWAYVPQWLEALMGQREREIIRHPQARFLQEDQEGNRYPNHQKWIESPVGTMLICGRSQKILG